MMLGWRIRWLMFKIRLQVNFAILRNWLTGARDTRWEGTRLAQRLGDPPITLIRGRH